jgi:asparagine synthase (glutamine-hydrolysing)
MCGIAGVVTDGAPVAAALHDAMLATLVHRGPDEEGVLREGPVALGMRRLCVIDPAGGHQPIRSEDGAVSLVYNGEVYNHRALREELVARGHRLAGGSDGEVLVHLYEEHGTAFVHRLQGMWALALWDARHHRLVLSRDRLGKKPLLWAQPTPGRLVFGSEPRAVLADPAVPRDVDLEALDAYLVSQYVPVERSAFAALRRLPPASTLVWEPGGTPRVERYWHLEHGPKLRIGMEEAAEETRRRLTAAVGARMGADVPLGAFLSGGIDSSAVVAVMARESGRPVRTFAATFAEQGFDEAPWARAVAERFGTDHTELRVGPVDSGVLLRLARHLGEPLADPAAVPAFQLAECAREHLTVALTGDGGDEAFGGYRRYGQLAATRPGERVPAAAWALAARALAARGGDRGRGPLPRAARLAGRMALDPARRYADLFRHLSDRDRAELHGPLLREATSRVDPLAHVVGAWASTPSELGWVDRAMAVDHATYLPGDLLVKADLTSMAHGLELRSPFLDHELAAWAARLPEELKRRGGEGKLVLREALRPWLGAGILDRPKQGWAVPVSAWLRGPLQELAGDVLLDRTARERGLLDVPAVERRLAAHRAGEDHGLVLWTLLMLELWWRTCVDAPAAAPALRAA